MTSDVPEGAEERARGAGSSLSSELLTSRHSGALQVHSLNSFSSPYSPTTLPSPLSVLSLAVYPVAPSLSPLPSPHAPDRHETLFLRKLALVSALRPGGRKTWKFDCPLINEHVFRRGRFSRFSDGLGDETEGKLTKGARNRDTGYRIQSLVSGVRSSYFEKGLMGNELLGKRENIADTIPVLFPYWNVLLAIGRRLNATS